MEWRLDGLARRPDLNGAIVVLDGFAKTEGGRYKVHLKAKPDAHLSVRPVNLRSCTDAAVTAQTLDDAMRALEASPDPAIRQVAAATRLGDYASAVDTAAAWTAGR